MSLSGEPWGWHPLPAQYLGFAVVDFSTRGRRRAGSSRQRLFPVLCDLRRAVFRSYQNGVPDERVAQEDFYAPSRPCNARLFENLPL